MKVLFFLDATLHTLVDRYQSCGVTYGFHPQVRRLIFRREDGQHIRP
jgi:hypothetical protein